MDAFRKILHVVCFLAVASFPLELVSAGAAYDRLVVFGDSLSDPGNAYVHTGMHLLPPYTSLIPDYPYARGGHHLSNGSTWIEQLAASMDLADSAGPALRVSGVFTNYAIDRTRACSESPSPSHIDLTAQVGMYLGEFDAGSTDALYVIFVGANDVRDALAFQEPLIAECALFSIYANLMALIDAGARSFLVANVPNLGLVPAVAIQGPVVQQIATEVSYFFNQELEGILSGFEFASGGAVSFERLDTFGLISQAAINHPDLDVTNPCIDIATGKVCAPTRGYLFWDGIHPTVTGHALIAEEASIVLGLSH